MRTNGDKRGSNARLALDLVMEVCLIDDAVHTPLGTRAQALAWLRRWRRKPGRVFWRVLPTGGLRMV